MSLEHYNTHIPFKHELSTSNKRLLIGRFMVADRPMNYYRIKDDFINKSDTVRSMIDAITINPVVTWAIKESYGGLFIEAEHIVDNDQVLDPMVYVRINMYVFLDEELITYCKLKYHDNLTRLIE